MVQEGTPVAQLMTAGILTVSPETPVTDAAETLLEKGVGSLVVVDETKKPVGVLTNTDLARFVTEGGGDAPVERYMSTDVVTVGTRNSLGDAASKMIINGVHHLPVTDDEGAVVGMLSTMDLTAYFSYTGGSETE